MHELSTSWKHNYMYYLNYLPERQLDYVKPILRTNFRVKNCFG